MEAFISEPAEGARAPPVPRAPPKGSATATRSTPTAASPMYAAREKWVRARCERLETEQGPYARRWSRAGGKWLD
jgi:hypothetical protein